MQIECKLMKEVLKKMKIKCSKKLKKTHLSDGAYNLLIEAIVLYGLLINLITCAFFADYVAMIPLRALVIGYLLISIIGIVMLTRYKAVLVKFVGSCIASIDHYNYDHFLYDYS